jgi:hypothetical protein
MTTFGRAAAVELIHTRSARRSDPGHGRYCGVRSSFGSRRGMPPRERAGPSLGAAHDLGRSRDAKKYSRDLGQHVDVPCSIDGRSRDLRSIDRKQPNVAFAPHQHFRIKRIALAKQQFLPDRAAPRPDMKWKPVIREAPVLRNRRIEHSEILDRDPNRGRRRLCDGGRLSRHGSDPADSGSVGSGAESVRNPHMNTRARRHPELMAIPGKDPRASANNASDSLRRSRRPSKLM